MSKKIIGIKQADGSFFPILKDGEPANKTIELTTVRDGQTAVKINLYKQYEDTADLEYVDTLLIENLVPHLKEEPSFNLSINLDEDNVLTAEVLDPETGAKSDTSVSLVTLSEAQLGDSSDFALADNTEIFDDIGTAPLNVPDDFSSLAEFEDDDIEKNIIDDDIDSLNDDSFDFGDTDFNLSEDSLGDDFDLSETSLEESAEEANLDDPFSLDDDFNLPSSESIEEGSVETEDDPFSMDDDFSFGDTDISTDKLNENEDLSEATDSLNMDGDDLSFPTEENAEDSFGLDSFEDTTLSNEDDSLDMDNSDFEFPENTKLHDDISASDDDLLTSLGDTSDDFSLDSLDMDDPFESTETTESNENTEEDSDFSTDLPEMSDDFGISSDDQEMSLDSTFDADFDDTSLDLGDESFDMNNDTFTSDSLDLGDSAETDSIDFNQDFDLDSNETFSMDSSEDSFGDDFDIGLGPEEDLSNSQEDSVQYAEYGEQEKKDDTSTSFIPPLYDKKLKEDIEKRRSRKKYSLPMIVCILCALICIVAVILAFAFGSWPGENTSVVNNVVTVEPPQVFEQEKMESMQEGKETIPPTPEENTIEIVIEKEVVPVKPEPAPEAIQNNISYLLTWGDTLWDLSDTYYRNPWLYNIIADANNIKDPDYIIAGTYIDIPPR